MRRGYAVYEVSYKICHNRGRCAAHGSERSDTTQPTINNARSRSVRPLCRNQVTDPAGARTHRLILCRADLAATKSSKVGEVATGKALHIHAVVGARGPEPAATPPLLENVLISLHILQITTDFHRSPAARWYSKGVRDAAICICGLCSLSQPL